MLGVACFLNMHTQNSKIFILHNLFLFQKPFGIFWRVHGALEIIINVEGWLIKVYCIKVGSWNDHSRYLLKAGKGREGRG